MTLLADSLDIARTARSGFDGIAIYDNFVRPDTWRLHAQDCTAADLVFSFNINPGFDGIAERVVAMAGEVSAPETRVIPVVTGKFGVLPAAVGCG